MSTARFIGDQHLFNSNYQLCVSGLTDTLTLLSTATLEQIGSVSMSGHSARVCSVGDRETAAFKKDGAYLVFAEFHRPLRSSTVVVHDVLANESVSRFSVPYPESGDCILVQCLRSVPENRLVFGGTSELLVVADATSGSVLSQTSLHPLSGLDRLWFSPVFPRSIFVSGSVAPDVGLGDEECCFAEFDLVREKAISHQLKSPCLSYIPDLCSDTEGGEAGSLMFLSIPDVHSVWCYGLDSGHSWPFLTASADSPFDFWCLGFHPERRLLLTGCSNGYVHAWDIRRAVEPVISSEVFRDIVFAMERVTPDEFAVLSPVVGETELGMFRVRGSDDCSDSEFPKLGEQAVDFALLPQSVESWVLLQAALVGVSELEERLRFWMARNRWTHRMSAHNPVLGVLLPSHVQTDVVAWSRRNQ